MPRGGAGDGICKCIGGCLTCGFIGVAGVAYLLYAIALIFFAGLFVLVCWGIIWSIIEDEDTRNTVLILCCATMLLCCITVIWFYAMEKMNIDLDTRSPKGGAIVTFCGICICAISKFH